MAEIMKFNATAQLGEPGHSTLQSEWRKNPISVGRIPADYGLPIMCLSGNRFHGLVYVESEGRDYDAIAPCCPIDTVTRGGSTNIFRLEQKTGTTMCFTNNTALAMSWPQCVTQAIARQIERVRAGADNATLARLAAGDITVGNAAGSGCEYVDYEILRQGIVKKSGCGGMRESVMGRAAAWSLVAGWLAVVVVSLRL